LFKSHDLLAFDVQKFLERHDKFQVRCRRHVVSTSQGLVKAVQKQEKENVAKTITW